MQPVDVMRNPLSECLINLQLADLHTEEFFMGFYEAAPPTFCSGLCRSEGTGNDCNEVLLSPASLRDSEVGFVAMERIG